MKFNVKGMACTGCENRIINSLELIDGVKKVKASFKKGMVEVKTKTEVDENIIKEKIESLGFEVI